MTKTRRQTKAKSAPQAADVESQPSSPLPSQTSFTLDIPDDIDTEALALLLPDAELETPSKDGIIALYRLVVAQSLESEGIQREVEGLKAEVDRKDIELDQAVQDKETAVSELESSLEKVRDELKQVKEDKEEIESARATLQTQLSSISTAESATHSEVEVLKHKIEDIEREKRDLIGVVSRLKEDGVQRDEEIQSLRSNLKQARQEYQALESQLREVKSTETSTKFKLESLTQQLELAKSEAERASADLATKSEEFSQYRRNKHSELVQLQASHDALSQNFTSLQSSHKTLQSTHTTQSRQLTQALDRIRDLEGQHSHREATFTAEVAGLKKLIGAMEQRENDNKKTVESIERDYETINERMERREASLREELEEQRRRALAAEKKVSELQNVMQRLDEGEFPVPSVPSTPVRGPVTPAKNGTPDFLTQGMMGLSPTVAMASRAQKGGKTFTEVYADYIALQEQHRKQSMEYQHMERTLSAVLAQIEERAPILAQQRQEYERLQVESTQLASQLATAISERDAHFSSAEENGQKLARSTRENELLQQQLNDLGRQVQALLKELGRIQDASIPPDEDLEADDLIKEAENIDGVITNNLVLFRSIPALQEQNQKLLKIVRELGEKMEAEEKEYRDTLEKEQVQAVYEAHEAIRKLQEQLDGQKKSYEIRIQAYTQELEALKATLMKERAMGTRLGAPSGVNGHDKALTDDTSSVEQELVEVQNQFEAYKAEIGQDTVRLREDLLAAQREVTRLSSELGKEKAHVENLSERNRMIQEQITAQGRELENLSHRNQDLHDQHTRIDIECNRVSEDLIASKGAVEQLRNECANLRAEKKIWESVQGRLTEENRILTIERTQLSDLMSNVQRMHSDLERSGENDRKRLESQIQMLEGQTQDLRTQLSQERDSLRHLSLQKDIELKELRNRIDKDSREYSKTREALVKAETSQKHLQDQVDQLSKQLQGNEEKLAVYERRPSATNNVSETESQNLDHDQQLEAEVAELRSSLKVAEVELAAARNHVQQFKDISQASEVALSSLSTTYDDYKATSEAQLAMRESDIDALKEKLQLVQDELTSVNEKHAELQRTLENERIAWTNDKKVLEDAIVDITTSEKSTESERVAQQEAVRQLEERAKAAEGKYSREVLAHAESIKSVEELRTQLTKANASARDNLAASETAQAKLATSEASWKQQKEALDKEVASLDARCKDLVAQNSLLHNHLDSVSSQAARIRQAADSSTTAELSTTDESEVKVSELRSVVAYLRKEKEIVDLQLELSKQETTRMKTQIEYLSQSLEETRKTLSEERERAVEAAASDAQHAELVERINQLAILRESNATLRADCEAHAKKARALDVKLQQMTAELNPTKEQLRVARAEVEAKEQQVQRLENESRRWQERSTQLLSKYDRIDPAEVQALKDEIERITAEKVESEKAAASREETQATKLSTLETAHENAKGVIRKNNEIAKRKFTEFQDNITQLQKQIETLTAECDSLKAKLEAPSTNTAPSREKELTEKINTLVAEKAGLEKALAEEKAKAPTVVVAPAPADASPEQVALIATLTKERDDLLAERATWIASTSSTGVPPDSQQWETEKAELMKARDEALAKLQSATETISALTQEVATLKHSNETFKRKVEDLTRARQVDAQRAASQQHAAVTAAVEKAKAEAQPSPDIAKHAEELRALEEKLTKKHQEELQTAVATASTASQASGEDAQAAIEAAIASRERELQATKDKDIAEAVERGRMEQIAKGKLKDHQLVRAQNKVKELEAQIQEWKAKGLLPTTPTVPTPALTAPPTAAGPSTSTTASASAPPTGPQRGGAPPATRGAARPISGRTPIGPGATHGNLPQKPGAAHPHPTAGRGRGGVPRGAAPRPSAAGLAIRGTAAAAGAQASTTPTAPQGGVSIMGAATKRSREEGEVSGDDSLAKRLKPAEGDEAGSGTTSKPLKIQRDRVS